MNIKKNIPLIIGVSIPILMVIFVVLSIYLPGIFIQPQYNFIYATGDYEQPYIVRINRIVKSEPRNPNYKPSYESKLFLHDVKLNTSKEITFEESQNYNLDPNVLSPDGFQVSYGSSDGGFFPFFFYSGIDYNTSYLKGNNVNKKLNINSEFYRYNFFFLGWIK